MCAPWLMYECAMTHTVGRWHYLVLRVRDKIHACVRHDAYMCCDFPTFVPWLVHVGRWCYPVLLLIDTTHLRVCHAAYVRAWFVRACAMTNLCVPWLICVGRCSRSVLAWHICVIPNIYIRHWCTGWPRPIRCLKLQVIFRKRATNYRALLRKMTYKDEASYDSTPPCIHIWYMYV